ncbi:MAG: TIGR02996 domain-containing protein [Myxococcales bacterium]
MAAILAAPDDEGPRLVYADWLQERSDPRGELIGLQCELEHLPVDGAARRTAIKRREAELLKAHEDAWLPAFQPRDSAMLLRLKFRRGFIEEACARLVHLDADLAALFAVTPFVRRLIVEGPERGVNSPEGWRETAFAALSRFPQLRQTARLELRDPLLDEQGTAKLAALEQLAGLDSLECVGHRVGDAGAVELAASRHLRPRALVLPQHGFARAYGRREPALGGIGDVGAQALASSEVCAQLTHLDLSDNPIGDSGRVALETWFERRAEKGWWAVAGGGLHYRKIGPSGPGATAPFVIGRGPLCQLVLRIHEVGREHLALWPRADGSFMVQTIPGCSSERDGRSFRSEVLSEGEYSLEGHRVRVVLKR